MKVVETPILTFPFIVILDAAVYETEVPEPIMLLKFPCIVKSVPGIVFTDPPDPLEKIRSPYVCAETVCAVPSYSTLLPRAKLTVL